MLSCLHVAASPTNDTTGKTLTTDVTALQPRHRKMDALKCLCMPSRTTCAAKRMTWRLCHASFPNHRHTTPIANRVESSVSLGYNAASEHGSTSSGKLTLTSLSLPLSHLCASSDRF